MIVCLGLIVVGIIAGVAWYLNGRHYESTDDAFIDSRPVLGVHHLEGHLLSPFLSADPPEFAFVALLVSFSAMWLMRSASG